MSEKLISVLSFSSRIFMISGLTFRSLIVLSLFLCTVLEGDPLSSFYVYLSSFPNTICWRACLFPIEYSCLLCHRLIDHTVMGWFLGSAFCSINTCACFCASTILFLVLQLCSISWNLKLWYLQFCSPFSRLLWLFRVFCSSVQILGLFVLVLWKILSVFW